MASSAVVPHSYCPITARHWLPKVAVTVVPIIGIIVGVWLEEQIKRERSVVNDSLLSQAESLRHQNHYKMGLLINSLICMSAAITGVTMGILLPGGGLGFALLFAGFGALTAKLLYRDISHVRLLETGMSPWGS